MAEPLPSRTLRDYLASLPVGPGAGVVDRNLVIRTDLATMAQAIPIGGTTGQVLTKANNTDLNVAWATAGVGDMQKSVYDPQNKNADAFARANQTGTQPANTISGLATVATTGAYSDLVGAPAIPSYLAPRVVTMATTATLTPNANNTDVAAISAQAGALTIAAPTGAPVDGQALIIRIRDNGNIRALTWNAAYTAFTPENLRTATVVGKTFLFQFIYSLAETQWQLIHSNSAVGLYN